VLTQSTLARRVRALQRAGKRVVFTNGCYDLLHIGHVTLLEKARHLGDALIVALNSDLSLKGLKGSGRPVMRQEHRSRVMAALECVDFVTIFDEDTPLQLIQRLRPDILVKGADWKASQIVGADVVKAGGGRVVRLPLVVGYSTSALIERIRKGLPAQ
jgi:D-beta-D-heptose 7-phosphate kinase/D-beta-D-heptose 1-phosphate adenosyltransferase